MGLFGSLFGGGGSKTKVQRVDTWNPEQKQLFRSLTPLIQQGTSGPAATAPQMYVPRTAEDQQFLNYANSQAVKNMATGKVPYQVGPQWAENYFEQAVRPISDYEWENTILPAIQEQYAGSTFASTGRDESVRKSAVERGLELSRQKAELMYNEELAKRQAIENAYGRISEGQKISGAAAEYSRAIETERIMDQVQRFLMGEEVNGQYNAAYNPMVAMAFNLLGLQPYSYGTTSQTEGQGLFTGLLGGLGKGVGQGFGNWLFS